MIYILKLNGMSVRVLFFGKLVEIAGTSLAVKDVQTTDELVKYLQQGFPQLAHEKYIIALDKNMIQVNTVLTDGCTVALLPPYSGG